MFRSTRTLSILALSAAATAAHASDGRINFTGELTAQTCTVTVNEQTSPAEATVTLPKVSTGNLSAAGQVAAQTAFNISLSNCSPSTGSVAAFFEAGAAVDPVSGNLRNTGTAGSVQLQLVDGQNGNAIKAGDSAQTTSTSRIPLQADGSALLPYGVRYYATGASTPGTVLGFVTYSINYQ